MANTLQIIIEAKDAATKDLQNVALAVKDMSKEITMLSGAMVGVGVGALKMVADARKLNSDLGQTGITLGLTAEQMRDMALAVTDVSFPLQSVTATFEALARAGIKGVENVEDTARAFDDLAEATGSSAEAMVNTLVPAFKTFGISIPSTAEGLDKFTWLAHNTVVDISDFASAMNYVAREGGNLGVTLDDMISIMAILESRGITGTAATMDFRTAISEATRTGKDLCDVLGISSDELTTYNQKIGTEAVGATEKYADAAKEAYGFLDRLKQEFSKLTLSIGTFLEPLEDAIGAFTNINIAIIAGIQVLPRLMTAFTALRLKLIAVGIAGKAMWAGLTLGISLAITGIVELIGHWDDVVTLFRGEGYRAIKNLEQAVKGLGDAMIEDIGGAAQQAINSLKKLANVIGMGQLKEYEPLSEETLSRIEKANKPLADQLRTLQDQIKAQGQIVEGYEDASRAARMLEIQTQLNKEDLPEAQRIELNEELAKLQKETWVTDWQNLVNENSSIVSQTLLDQASYWDTYFQGIKDGWDGTNTYLKTVVMPEFNKLVKEGFLTPSVAQDLIKTYEDALKGVERKTWKSYESTVAKMVTPEAEFLDLDAFLRKISGFQQGGIVTRPTLAMVGERGAEAVIPLDQLEGRGGNIINNYFGVLPGDDVTMRKLARTLKQFQDEDSRRNAFGQVNSGYYFGRSAI